MIVHDLADLGTTLIGRAVLTVCATAGAATALLYGDITLAIHLRGGAGHRPELPAQPERIEAQRLRVREVHNRLTHARVPRVDPVVELSVRTTADLIRLPSGWVDRRLHGRGRLVGERWRTNTNRGDGATHNSRGLQLLHRGQPFVRARRALDQVLLAERPGHQEDTHTQLAVDDEEYDADDDEPSLPADLRGQHIPPGAHITDIPLTGGLL